MYPRTLSKACLLKGDRESRSLKRFSEWSSSLVTPSYPPNFSAIWRILRSNWDVWLDKMTRRRGLEETYFEVTRTIGRTLRLRNFLPQRPSRLCNDHVFSASVSKTHARPAMWSMAISDLSGRKQIYTSIVYSSFVGFLCTLSIPSISFSRNYYETSEFFRRYLVRVPASSAAAPASFF